MNLADKTEKALKLNQPIDGQYPRNNDAVLVIRVWELEGLYLSPYMQRKYMESSSPDSITRYRRRFQEQGKYPADKEVDDARFNKFKKVREKAVDKTQRQLF